MESSTPLRGHRPQGARPGPGRGDGAARPDGFWAKSHLHTAKILRLSLDLPIVIEIVDSEENVNKMIPHLDEMVRDGLVTLEDVRVLKYRADPK